LVFLGVFVAALPVCRLHIVDWWDGRTADVFERFSKEEALALLRYPS
jgi:hypothetical protein